MPNTSESPDLRPACGNRNGPTPCILVKGHDLNHAAIWRDQWALWRNDRPGAYGEARESEQAKMWRTTWKASADFQAAIDQLGRNQEQADVPGGQSG